MYGSSLDKKSGKQYWCRSVTTSASSGDVVIEAAKDYRQTGSDVLTPQGNVNIAAQRVTINEARNTVDSTTLTSFRQTGVTVALSSPVITAVQTVQQMAKAASNTKDPRLQVLAAANVGMAGKTAYDAVQAGQGKTINGKENQIATTDANGNPTSRDSTAADKAGGFSVSITVGTSSSNSTTVNASNTAAGSTVHAGRDVNIAATGAGTASDLRIQGSTIKAGQAATLQADGDIALLAATNSDEQHSKNKSSSASIGVAISSDGGIGVVASGSIGRGHADGSDITHTNTHITASQITTTSGGDTTLQGAVANAAQVTTTVGGDLLIESLQDTTHFDSDQKNASAGVMVGTSASGNASYSQSEIDSDYASVVEQSGIRAGDGGFTVHVAGNATLKGGAITSTQTAVEQGRNTFTTEGALTTTDILNNAHYKATSVNVSVGTGMSPTGQLMPAGSGIGLGKDSDSDASTTQAAISGMAGNKDARTGDKETGIAQIFDAGTVQKEIDAQVQITLLFGQQGSKAIGDYAESKLKEANGMRAQAAQTDDAGRSEQLLKQAADLEANWSEGGAYRIALHTTAGAASGGVQGALGAGMSATTASALNEAQEKITSTLKDAGFSATAASNLAKAVTTTVATVGGAAIGGASGAVSALNVDANNRALHPDETAKLKQLQHGKTQGQQQRLADAACALTRCATGVPDSDPNKAALAASEQRGQQYAAEQSQLKATGLFIYDGFDKFTDTAFRYQIPNRTAGAVQGVVGSAAAAGAIITGCTTVVGCGLGAAIAGTSLDYSYAGFQTLVNGNVTPTYGEQVLQSFGMNPVAAALTYGAVNLGATAGSVMLANQAGIKLTQANVLAQASYVEFNPNGIKITPEVMKSTQAQTLIKEIQAGTPGIPVSDAVDIAAGYIQSATALPQIGIATSSSMLIKVVPKGEGVKATSGYWMSPQQAQAIAVMTPEQAGRVLGLPATQAANMLKNGVDFYAITPNLGVTPTVFISNVATTTQGAVSMPGGAQQVIVPNRNQWTTPVPVNPFTLSSTGGR